MTQLEVLQTPPNRRANPTDRRHRQERRLFGDRRHHHGEQRVRATTAPTLTVDDVQTLNELLSEAHARIRKLERVIDTLTKAL